MKKTIAPEYPIQPHTAENYRFVQKISIAGVPFLKDRNSVMASTHVGDSLQLVREPDNAHDPNAISRISDCPARPASIIAGQNNHWHYFPTIKRRILSISVRMKVAMA